MLLPGCQVLTNGQRRLGLGKDLSKVNLLYPPAVPTPEAVPIDCLVIGGEGAFSSLFLGRDNEPLYSGVGRRGFPWCFLVN